MLFLHPRELRNIRMDMSLKGAVIDSLKLKQMFWPLLACQWLRTRCGMKNSPQKGKKLARVKSIRRTFCSTSLYSSTWKRVWCFDHKSTSESHAGWLRCSSRKLEPSVTYLAQIYKKRCRTSWQTFKPDSCGFLCLFRALLCLVNNNINLLLFMLLYLLYYIIIDIFIS